MNRYLIAVVFFILLIIVAEIRRVSGFAEFCKKILFKFEKLLKINRILKNTYDKSLMEFGVINGKSEENRIMTLSYLLLSLIFTLLCSFFISKVVLMWYMLVVIMIAEYVGLVFLGKMYLTMKIDKLHKLFPEALQIFIDKYMNCKNIKKTIDECYVEMPGLMKVPFEKLSRELSSGRDFEEAIDEFGEGISNIWVFAFCTILKLSYENAGDIVNDLLFLNELVTDDEQSKIEDKSELSSNTLMMWILNGFTLVIFAVNLMVNDMARDLYFLTDTGNLCISCWIGSILLGTGIVSILKRG